MPTMHDTGVATSIRARVASLRPDSPRQWGKMSIDQMLWHVNLPLRESLGEYPTPAPNVPLPKALFRWMILTFPWGKSAPTRPDMKVAGTRYDFEVEKKSCLHMIDRFMARPMDGPWPRSANMGEMQGKHWSKLHFKHLDHHLRQFGA